MITVIEVASFFVFLYASFSAFEKHLVAKKLTDMWLLMSLSLLFFAISRLAKFISLNYGYEFMQIARDSMVVAGCAFLLSFLIVYDKHCEVIDAVPKPKKKAKK